MSIEGNGISSIGTFDASPLEASFEIERGEQSPNVETIEVDTDDNVGTSLPEIFGQEVDADYYPDDNGVEDESGDTGGQGDVESGGADVDYSHYSDAQILALSYIEDGVLPEDTEINDLDAAGLKQKLLENLETIAESRAEERLRQKVPTEQHYEYAEMLFNGATDEETVYARTLDQLATLDITVDDEQGERLRRHVIEQHYIAKGFSKEKAEKFANTHFEDGEDEDEAKAAQSYFAGESKKLKESIKQQAEEERKRVQEKNEKFRNDVKSKIESGEFGGIKLTSKEKKKLLPALFESTEVLETPDGKTHKVTLYQKKLYEIQNDPDKQLLLAKLVLFDDLSAEKIKSRAKTESDRDLLKFLDGNNKVRPSTIGKANKQQINRQIQPLRTINMR